MFSFPARAKTPRNISLFWILLYLPLHQIVAQTVHYENAFLVLRAAFFVFLVVTLLLTRKAAQVHDIFIGRWLHGRKDWAAALIFLLFALGAREVLSVVFQYRKEDLANYALLAVAAPINEEIVFRGLFLGAFLAYAPERPWGAIILTTLLFIGCHDLTSSGVEIWITLAVQSLIYAACYVWTGCVPLCILCHCLWNTMWFVR
jgi:membrane protease YdiL (CAAX protease family)